MSKRLQVVLDNSEWREIAKHAKAQRLTVSAWVRQVLRAARDQAPPPRKAAKLAAIRAAATHQFPAPDISQMLSEIESGYRS